ncbi:methyltransferase domain-containing protein [Allobranchiibius sp. GilTou73]|uniref:methyltransferase domain-containing protein n=1 Tax=Allobranchiibius sp. GilTou73 TaxID=2904523 RepID=UPI001F42404B|nr:methyltransferase domain-containing protein [Allobranchiibius sp. GilTou73]UIJ34865.1 methyltransferase domain-containing protein [Allobranchiibius sp. GilTou73]
MATWDPTQYERYADLRTRPFLDLLARVPHHDPKVVLDLGCGNGIATLIAAERWPDATVVGVDDSVDMLRKAADRDTAGRVRWVEADVATVDVGAYGRPDVILTNATLQWVPGHLDLIPRWLESLAESGVFAMQVPGNFDAPSHRIIRETAREQQRGAELVGLLRADPVSEPQGYADVLAAAGARLDVWETTYLQVLDAAGEQDHPVLEWVKGTALRPLLDVLDPAETRAFLADLADRLNAAYPRAAYGVPFPFRRIFAVGVLEARP